MTGVRFRVKGRPDLPLRLSGPGYYIWLGLHGYEAKDARCSFCGQARFGSMYGYALSPGEAIRLIESDWRGVDMWAFNVCKCPKENV